MINLQWNHEQIMNFSNNSARCTCPGPYDDPMLEIDNNLSERILRMVVIGRKNYMFAGSEAGAWRASIIYSLVASCKLNGIDPFRYFRDVLARVSTHPADKIDELLPGEWKKLNAEADADLGDDIAKIVRVA